VARRGTGLDPAVTEPIPAVHELSGERLRAMAGLWKRSARELVARFSGSSMLPTIPSGAEVVVRCGAAPGLNDIIAFVRDDRLVVHRVVALSASGDWILTRGDAWAIPDPPITDPGCILGLVTGVRGRDGFAAPGVQPRSLGRRLGLAVCVAALGMGHGVGRRFIRALTLLRRWLIAIPRGYAGTVRRRVAGPRQRGGRSTTS